MYIYVLSLLHESILDNLTSFAHNQLTQHQGCYYHVSSTKILHIITVYHDKAESDPFTKHALFVIDIPPVKTIHQLYTQAWINAMLTFLQRPNNVQIIVDAYL